MSRFGRRPYPKRYGGGPSTLETEHRAVLDALSPGWDVSEETAIYAETYAQSLAVTAIWQINGRLAGSRIPARMLETLPTWEESCALRPAPNDSVATRRARVAAKLLSVVGNTLANLYDICAAYCGAVFLGFAAPDESVVTTYWPGINPGPPGFEWTSGRAVLCVRLAQNSLSDPAFSALFEGLSLALQPVLPAWMTVTIGTDEGGFTCDIGTVDLTIL